jgi:hypothetical protein
MSINGLLDFSIQLASYAFIIGFSGLVFFRIDLTLTKGQINPKEDRPVKQVSTVCILLSKLGLIVALIGFVFTGLWWLWEHFFEYMNPGRLALYSLIIGPAPLLLPLSAKIICKLTGGTIDASQVQGCTFSGLNFNGLVHSLFVSYFLVFLTGGLAVFGLLGSGVWALVKLF